MIMFKNGDIVKVLIPNVINSGYDYRLTENADVGDFVRVTVMNRQYVGVIVGAGDSNLDIAKIKPVIEKCSLGHLSQSDIGWIYKMSDWTLMAPGAVLRLVINVVDAFNPPKYEQLYTLAPEYSAKITEAQQRVIDAFQSNDNDSMSINDIMTIGRSI